MERADSYGTAGELRVDGRTLRLHRLDRLEGVDGFELGRLPYSLRVVLENLLRHEDGDRIKRDQIEALLGWGDADVLRRTIDLHPARVFLHDTNGVPAVVDLAAMRHAMAELGGDPTVVNPGIPAELVIDHSVIADVFGTRDAFARNVEIEYARNAERYRFLRWGQQSFDNFVVVPPGTGIMHQVNCEYLARVVVEEDGWAFPDVCLGTDSHTTMVNGLGVLGWGIGGIEAEAAMLGQSLSMLVPRVVGFRLHGSLPAGSTATDLVLTITEMLRAHGVVGAFVEFFGPGVTATTLADRITISNMSPEFGSTCAYFPVDEETLRYLRFTGRPESRVRLVEAFAKAQGLWHDPDTTPDYTEVVELDLASVVPSIAGPRRPQDRVVLDQAQAGFRTALEGMLAAADRAAGPEGHTPGAGWSWVDEASDESFPASDAPAIDVPGIEQPPPAKVPSRPLPPRRSVRVPVALAGGRHELDHGAVAIAAITSCTNTSNPSVMVAAGLLAQRAVQRGLAAKPWVKTSLSPGSRVVTDYLDKAGLTASLEALGFHLAGYGCMTCIGASGPLIEAVADAVDSQGLAVASVLSGNRNFDGRIHAHVRMNYLASPPLVVAYALAGTLDTDFRTDPLGHDREGAPVYLRDLWPTPHEVQAVIDATVEAEMFTAAYADVFAGDERWRSLDTPQGPTFGFDEQSTYVRRPPYLDAMPASPPSAGDLAGARVLVMLGDSVTTDHVSPAGAIPPSTVAGKYLADLGVSRAQLNTYASRRGNHEVMMRGTFANVRLRNQLVPGVEGGWTIDHRTGRQETIYHAAMGYAADGIPLVILGGKEYGTGSSRDWAAKGPALLGVRAVLAESFERIHRSNLIGMGILPLEYLPGENAASLSLTGHEAYAVTGLAALDSGVVPATVDVTADEKRFQVRPHLDTAREVAYYRHGGVMPYVIRQMLHRRRNVGNLS